MKHILESAEVMEQYAIIDMCYHAMQKISQDMSQRPKSGLELLIDHQTGYGEAKIKEWKETSIDLLKQIIKAKKIIEADFRNDEKMLIEIQNI